MATEEEDQSRELEAQAKRAFDLERSILEKSQRVSATMWELAADLHEFHEAGAWSHLGYDTLNEFLAQPGLGLKRTQFFRLTKIWRDLIVVRKIEPSKVTAIEPSKVAEVVPAIMRGDVKPEDALDDAEHLGQRDLRRKYHPTDPQTPRGKSGSVGEEEPETEEPDDEGYGESQGDPDDVPLDPSTEEVYVQCEACGSWYTPDDGGEQHEEA